MDRSEIAALHDLTGRVAIVTGAVFLGLAVKVYRDPQPKLAMALFGWSITYVTLLFGAMAVDVMVRNGL